ncbi:MAG: circularly permuted type 2 ATP-grasp protein [Parvibaculum sp.]
MSESNDPFSPRGAPDDQPSLFGEAGALGYAPTTGLQIGGLPAFDEIVTGNGRLRPHWQSILARLAPLSSQEMSERVEESRRLLRQNDVTYTIYDDPQSGERLWPLDVLPLLIPADEWREIEAGVLQRARLLDALLADIYGPQQMVAEGILPPALIEANPGFLRPCHGVNPQGGRYLHLSAVDLARGADGRWRVLADRTEAPSGAGYALENRSVIGRVLSDCISDMRVEPLMPFFAALREGLAELAPRNKIDDEKPPRIVLLTPGPYNETYFEHLFLANHLGLTLVEGADLTVRNARVYIKTVSALEPVDIILRRVDDMFCDPLDLNADSALGVPGLIEATRAGNVTVANALGSGVLQAMAFKPFLPALSRRLLGEELALPDVASWWCGGDAALAHVLANLEDLVIKSAFPTPGNHPIFGADLSPGARKALAEEIAAEPMKFVGQERASLSNAPVWREGEIEPRQISLRVYVASGPDGFVVMPGGLTRTSRVGGSPIVSMQSGGGSKDTWILDDMSPRAANTNKPRSNVVELLDLTVKSSAAATSELPSRAADGLFWMGRYAERTDGAVRLLRTLVTGLTDPARGWSVSDAEPLLNLAARLQLLPWVEPEEIPTPGIIALIRQSLVDPTHPTGIVRHLRQLAIAAGNVRDRLPVDCWRAVNALDHPPKSGLARATPVQIVLRLDELVMLSTSLIGSVNESMPRNDSWRFLEIGRRLERAIHLVTVLRNLSGVPTYEPDDIRRVSERRQLQAIVALIGARILPGMQDNGRLERRRTLEAVLTNAENPRSLVFQLSRLMWLLDNLPAPSADGRAAEALVIRAREDVEAANRLVYKAIDAACPPGRRLERLGDRPDERDILRNAFAAIDNVLPDVSNRLSSAYFTHAFARRA